MKMMQLDVLKGSYVQVGFEASRTEVIILMQPSSVLKYLWMK